MKATRKHKDIRSIQAHRTSYHYRIKKVVMVVAVIIGAIIGTLVWAIVRPVIRGAGWIISLITATLIIYWLITL